jgi:CO/xanthine dehydrogenase FAD-binding subunit
MDLGTVTTYRRPTSRGDLALAPGERILGGGTWLFSEPQMHTTGLVDLTTMGWVPLEPLPDGGLRIAATCTITQLLALPANGEWTAQPLFRQAAECLLASFKVWTAATVGGNIAQSFAAGAMISMATTLDGIAEVWRADGTDARIPVAEIPAGNGVNSLGHGDVIRAIELPGSTLRSRTALRKIALAELGRSGGVLTGRLDADGSAVFVITAATLVPVVLRYPSLPPADRLRADADAAPGYYTDPLGPADWRRHIAGVLLVEVLEELRSPLKAGAA